MQGLKHPGASLVVAISLLSAPARAGGPPAYTAQYLGGGTASAAMNESAVAVGTTTSGGVRGWVASIEAGFALLPLPPGMASSWANDINDAGVIVGAVSASSSPEFGGEAASWTPDGAGGYAIALLGKLPGHVRSNATALNNAGDIVGYSSDGTYRLPVLFLGGGSVQNLLATGIFDPQDVNDQRMVVDSSFTVKRLDLNTMQVLDLGVPPGPPAYLATDSAAINESNQVAGLAITAGNPNCDRLAARWSPEVGWQVLSQCGSSNGAYDINDHGDVVMRLNLAPYVRFEGVGTFKIEDLIQSEVGHWYAINSFGLAINNARQMMIWASNDTTGENGAVLLTPVPVETPGDANADGVVDVADLVAVVLAWGPCPAPPQGCPADLNGDGTVDVQDLVLVVTNWS
jgi:hypothetical protein